MAGNWIKFDTSTSDKPEVWAIATAMNIDPDAVIGKLLRVWSWFDDHTEKGNAPSVTKALLDRRVGVSGFCESMISAGWMTESSSEISLPNFDRHNGQTAKNRVQTAKRVANHKKSNGQGNGESVTPGVSGSLPKEEEIRVEKNTPPLSPQSASVLGLIKYVPSGDSAIETNWQRWCNFRLAKDGQEIDQIQAEELLMKLGRLGPEKANRDISFSIEKGAKTLLDSDNDFERQRSAARGGKPKREHFEI